MRGGNLETRQNLLTHDTQKFNKDLPENADGTEDGMDKSTYTPGTEDLVTKFKAVSLNQKVETLASKS